jgi:hypothetical protein
MYFLHRLARFVTEYEAVTDWHACCIATRVHKWTVIAPLLLAAACSKPGTPPPVAQSAAPAQTLAAAPPVATPSGNPEPVAPVEAPPARAEFLVPSGTALRVRLDASIDTRRNHAGDEFTATLNRPVTVQGDVAIPAGTRFRGHVTEAAPSGRLAGRPVIGLTLDSFRIEGREYPLRTSSVERVGPAHKKRNAFLIGGGAGLGAAIGAIAGGGKGAAIGGLAGAGAGTAGAAATGKEELAIPAESALIFTMRAPVHM